MLRLLCLFFLFQIIFSFPLPSLPDPEGCSRCECSVKNWVCNIKCPDQQIGTRKVCGIEEYSVNSWTSSQAKVLQTADSFCQRAQILNDHAHLAVGNFFQISENVDLSRALDCLSIRLGDERRRQRITFDLIPPIHENPSNAELVIYERANGTRDGRLDARFDAQIPLDNYLPEAFAFSLLVDGTWSKNFYSGVPASLIPFKGELVPDWKNRQTGYHMDFDAWSTVIEFREFGIPEGGVVSGIRILNLQPGDMILGEEGSFGELVFKQDVETVCVNQACFEPRIAEASKTFGDFDYDPDIVWIGPYTGRVVQ